MRHDGAGSAYKAIDDVLRAELARRRHAAGVTQAELARRLRWQQSVVSKIESGVRAVGLAELISLASALGIDPVEFFEQVMRVAEQQSGSPRRRVTGHSQRANRGR